MPLIFVFFFLAKMCNRIKLLCKCLVACEAIVEETNFFAGLERNINLFLNFIQLRKNSKKVDSIFYSYFMKSSKSLVSFLIKHPHQSTTQMKLTSLDCNQKLTVKARPSPPFCPQKQNTKTATQLTLTNFTSGHDTS